MNIFTGRKWRRKISRSSKNACNPVETGMSRILIPSCGQIYNFPLSIYSVDGVPVLDRVPDWAALRIHFHFCSEVSGDQNNTHAFLTIIPLWPSSWHILAREFVQMCTRLFMRLSLAYWQAYTHTRLANSKRVLTDDVLLFEKVKSKTIKRKK